MSADTHWWHKEGDKIVCDLCPRNCRLSDQQRGFCFVRQNIGGEMNLTTYGKSTGFCVDPIEKKPLNHFLPGTPVLSFGTAGCNLGCKFCQNWDISKAKKTEVLSNDASPDAIVEAALQANCRSIAFTYNDPIIFAEYAIDTAIAAHDADIKTVAVTAGYITPEARKDFFKHIDAANIDLKAFSAAFYKHLTLSNLEPVLDTLRWLKHETDVWFEITNLIIPGENDSRDEMKRMVDWVLKELGDDVPIHFSAFHPDYKMLDKPRTPHETLVRARAIAHNQGIKFAYVGNVHDVTRQSTYCPDCDSLLIERDWYQLGEYGMDGSECKACGCSIAGVFDETRGDWGAKRMPIRIDEVEDTVTISPLAMQYQPEADGDTEHQLIDRSLNGEHAQIEFNDEHVAEILLFARQALECVVRGVELPVTLPKELHGAPTYGLFLTLRRGSLLRACRGSWGSEEQALLGDTLQAVVRDTALHDHRFPSISKEELPFLTLEISLMHSPKLLETQSSARVHEVEVGKHGLAIFHPQGRGLLLPQVAIEQGFDALRFLQRTSEKAGLHSDAWKDAESQVLSFCAKKLASAPSTKELNVEHLGQSGFAQLFDFANKLQQDQAGKVSVTKDLLERYSGSVGLKLETQSGLQSTAFADGKNLLEVVQSAIASLKQLASQYGKQAEPLQRLTLLSKPVLLRAEEYPERHHTVQQGAVLGASGGQNVLIGADIGADGNKVEQALSSLQIAPSHWNDSNASLVSYSAMHFQMQPPQERVVRPAARAGQFYPAGLEQMEAEVLKYLSLANGQQRHRVPAIMLPHAGWRFCGETLGKTIARAMIPNRVVILSPKHTAHGPLISIASEDTWQLPGVEVPIDADLRQKLSSALPLIPCETEAHRLEHGIEAVIPFVRALNPRVQILPIVFGNIPFAATTQLAQVLASFFNEDTLLIVSSDMNHFAAEEENRRRDQLALEAMATGNARHLIETCQQNDISMCGQLPASVAMQAVQMLFGNLRLELADYSTSAQASGDTSRVVGYAGALFHAAQ